MAAPRLNAETRGIVAKLKTYADRTLPNAKTMPRDSVILANLCGRGDKDIFTVAEKLGVEI